jgi:flagellar motor switch protein FliG
MNLRKQRKADMVNVIIGISLILTWLVTTFFIVCFVIKTRKDLLARFSESQGRGREEKTSEDDENIQYKPFDYIKHVEPLHLLNLIQQEHPQVIALVLAHLEANNASVILQNLPDEIQSNVIRRIACMDYISPEIIREIERVLEKKLSTLSGEDYSAVGGVESAVEILNLIDQNFENQIIKALESEEPELAEAIKSIKAGIKNIPHSIAI